MDWLAANQTATSGRPAGSVPSSAETAMPHGSRVIAEYQKSASRDMESEFSSTVERASPTEQIAAFAEAVAEPTWAAVQAGLGPNTSHVLQVKEQLANHVWCDLFVGFVRVAETSGNMVDSIPDTLKRSVKAAVLDSSQQRRRPAVSSAIVDLLVDNAWAAFTMAVTGQVNLLSTITGGEAARALRALAVFSCPAPGEHKEVREHALKPLGDEVQDILTDQTKDRLAKLFTEWPRSGDLLADS